MFSASRYNDWDVIGGRVPQFYFQGAHSLAPRPSCFPGFSSSERQNGEKRGVMRADRDDMLVRLPRQRGCPSARIATN